MDDYSRVAVVIEYLHEHCRDQPDIKELASVVGLSSSRFHRLFRRWAGITPEAFLRCLAAMEAKRLLDDDRSVMDAALDADLSGPSRLHDLCIDLDAASPGEIKSGYAATPFGEALIATSPRGICRLSFVDNHTARATEWDRLQSSWSGARLFRDDKAAGSLAKRAFGSQKAMATTEPLKGIVKGTAFQLRVWHALLDIPFGSVRTYGDVARELGMPNSARAVGNAVANNPLGYLVPCHRVIPSTGITGNYGGGVTRKKAMIAWEQAPRQRGLFMNHALLGIPFALAVFNRV